MHFLHQSSVVVSRPMVSTTIICSSNPRVSLPSFIIGGTYGVGDALKCMCHLLFGL
ncbi:unnamed protein product [Prunus armeniaca]